MLSHLHIENIAVVKCADIDLSQGFTVFTGETGAGKSVIIDCLSLISGEKISRDCIRYGEREGIVEAVFLDVGKKVLSVLSDNGIDADDEVIVRYTMTSDGKSTARINGKSVTKTFMKQIGRLLVSVCGQDDGRALYNSDSYIPMLDSYMGACPEKEEYEKVYNKLTEVKSKLSRILSTDASVARERDMLTYQIKDIDSKKLKVGEEEELEAEKKKLLGAERITKQIGFTYKALKGAEKGNAAFLVSRSAQALLSISDVIPELSECAERLQEISYELTDIAELAYEHMADIDENPTERIDEIESRLAAISSLKKRYGDSIEEILSFRKKAAARLEEIDNSESLAEEYRKKSIELEADARKIAASITSKRREAADSASLGVLEVLSFLDMPGVKFKIDVVPSVELNVYGADVVKFLIATNPGEEMLPMEDIVSGGEMSRITLALRSVMNRKEDIGCTVYDEIDTGISGKTSRKIGIKLREISLNTQVISVTHSAQIATLADFHYLIEKKEVEGRAQTFVTLLDFEERVSEASRILGGINITKAQIQAARDMLLDKSNLPK